MNQFRTNSYNELEKWFENLDKSTLVTAHLIEPVLAKPSSLIHSRPYIVSAYGTNNKVDSIDIFRKWMYIYKECKTRNINVIGFSSNGDPRYLKAMRLALGFFARAPNIESITGNNDLFNIDMPPEWDFFFLRSHQVFLCMQDGIHLATKIRNRLLSKTATLCINGQHISMNPLLDLIEGHSKLDHNLVKSDIYPHDRQNYSSCLKITSDDVLGLLNRRDTKATFIYLYILKLIIFAYIKKDADILDRLFYGWTVVFSYRMWW